VGAGQSEVDIMKYAHTVIVALPPGMGDDIQAIKAGILEIGDIFCVNKADLPGADRTLREIEMMLSLKDSGDGGSEWIPPVLKTVAASPQGTGIRELVDAVEAHHRYLRSGDLLRQKNLQSSRAVLEEYLRLLTVQRIVEEAEADGRLANVLNDLLEGRSGPLEAAQQLTRGTSTTPGMTR